MTSSRLARFREALQRMCGAMPPEDICLEWFSNQSVSGVDRLQDWVCTQPGLPSWAMGLATIEAAEQWAANPADDVIDEDDEA